MAQARPVIQAAQPPMTTVTRRNSQADGSIHQELRHRGELPVEYPDGDLWTAAGGAEGVAALIEDLYRRIEQDELLSVAFPHFNSGDAAFFFVQWFGGSRGYSNDLFGGLLRRHQHRYTSASALTCATRFERAHRRPGCPCHRARA